MSRKASPEKMTAFGKMVSERLGELGVSQKELAKKLYINHVYLNRLFYGDYVVQMRTIVSIAKELDIDVVKLAEAALNEREDK